MKPRLILAACDDQLLLPLSASLIAAGYRVQSAASGLELLRKARRRLPDLIILDSILPDMDGNTVCEILSLLPSTNSVPRILLAAPVRAFSPAPALPGFSGAAPAPRFDLNELARRVHEILGQPEPAYSDAEDSVQPKKELLNTVF